MEMQIQHFGHPHLLELTNSQTLNIITPCSACKLQSSGWMYTCKPCNFTLHTSCSQLPPLFNHPGHAHTLSLLPTPAYSAGSFVCDACGQSGHGFSYHCRQCRFDIHSVCATKPLSILHQSHPCPLNLSFYPPYKNKRFKCDVCGQTGSDIWLYRCSICDFDAHLSCASIARYTNRSAGQSNLQYRSTPVQNMQWQSQINYGAAMTGNTVMSAAALGFVGGAAGQVGKNAVQSWTANDSNNGSNGENGENHIFTSIIDSVSSVLYNMFGDI